MTDDEWTAARSLVLRYGWNAAAYQILNPGVRRWFSACGDAVAGYSTYAGVRVVRAGAPVCGLERLEAVVDELEADANAHRERVVFFGAGARLEQLFATRRNAAIVSLGAQPVWNPSEWAEIVARKASLRAQLHRAKNKDVRVEEWPVDRARHSEPLRAVLREWLATRGLPPLGFMVTPDLLARGEDRRVFVATRGRSREVIGYLVATPIPARAGWLVEQWPRARSAPNGTTHLLVDAAMRGFASVGSTYTTLGLAPLSRHGADVANHHEPAWLRWTLRWLRAHGRRFYNFRGLEAFKASLQPTGWEPLHAVAPRGRFTPLVLRGIAGVFAEGSPERLITRAIASAAAHEIDNIYKSTERRFTVSHA